MSYLHGAAAHREETSFCHRLRHLTAINHYICWATKEFLLLRLRFNDLWHSYHLPLYVLSFDGCVARVGLLPRSHFSSVPSRQHRRRKTPLMSLQGQMGATPLLMRRRRGVPSPRGLRRLPYKHGLASALPGMEDLYRVADSNRTLAIYPETFPGKLPGFYTGLGGKSEKNLHFYAYIIPQNC